MTSHALLLPPWSLLSLRQFYWSTFHMDANVIFLCTCGLTTGEVLTVGLPPSSNTLLGTGLEDCLDPLVGQAWGRLGLGTLIGEFRVWLLVLRCVCVANKTMDALWEGSHCDRIVGGRKQGGGQGLAKHSHLISQGSPFAPPPTLPPCHSLTAFHSSLTRGSRDVGAALPGHIAGFSARHWGCVLEVDQSCLLQHLPWLSQMFIVLR